MERHIHHISFDIPYPPNYGGIIDVFYKLQALVEAGIKVHLHCFQYADRQMEEHLEELCTSVHYYPRKPPLASLPVRYPHIVRSRRSNALLKNLVKESYPILFEGIHTTYYLSHPKLEGRRKLVRMHNIEWEYYYQLAQREEAYLKKQYFLAESKQLKAFEGVLPYADMVLAISPKDKAYYEEKLRTVAYLPAFHANQQISTIPGTGDYCLYHGKLSVPENHEAAMFLINEVFAEIEVPLIIAGAEPLPDLISAVNPHEHIWLRPNPGEGEMEDLIRKAQVQVIPTFQATGIKLKLLNSLFSGRHVLTNPPMVLQTGLEFFCHIAEAAEDFQKKVKELFQIPFDASEMDKRQLVLEQEFSNKLNAEKLIQHLFPTDIVAV